MRKKIINPWVGVEGYNCYGCSPQNPIGMRMAFYEEGDEIVSEWTPTSDHQGWLNTLHGGVQATLIDEIACWVIARKMQRAGVTSRMSMKYKKPVMTNEGKITLRASVKETLRNVVTVEVRLYNHAGEICTTGEVVYFTFSDEKSRNEMHFETCKTEDEL